MARVLPSRGRPPTEAPVTRKRSLDSDDEEEELSLNEVWFEYHSKARRFFSAVEFAHDGGFDEVPSLFTLDRFLVAAFQLGCLVLNIFFIVQPNVAHLLSHSVIRDRAELGSRWLLLNTFLSDVLHEDAQVDPGTILAVMELCMLGINLLRLARALWEIATGRDADRWHGMSVLLWHIIPTLSSFSAMRTLHNVTPKVFMPALQRELKIAAKKKNTARLVHFVLKTIGYALVGFESFMIKFSLTAERQQKAESFLQAFLVAAAFLNQLLGVVDVSKFAQKRLFTFIFAGEDSFLSRYEEHVAKTWLAMLAMHIWRNSQSYRPSLLWFAAVGLAYTDRDFQRLTLEEAPRSEQYKSQASSALRGDLAFSSVAETCAPAGDALPPFNLQEAPGGCMLTIGCFRPAGHRGVCAVRDS